MLDGLRRLLGHVPQDAKNSSYEHLWLQLEILWQNTEKLETPEFKARAAVIDALFKSRPTGQPGDSGWADANRIEQLIGSLLSPQQIYSQYLELLELARQRKVGRLQFHESQAKTWFAAPPGSNPDSDTQKIARDAYLSLVSDLQEDFIGARLARNLNRTVSAALSITGLAVLTIAFLPLLIDHAVSRGANAEWKAGEYFNSTPSFALVTAIAFGVLGAFFSRLTRFQSAGGSVRYDDYKSNYMISLIITRLVSGAFGALIFYFLIRSGLVGGDAFPDIGNMKIDTLTAIGPDGITAEQAAKLKSDVMSAFHVVAPNKDLAKLLVWSFLAGFSERLVPDTLVRTEGRSQEAK